MNNRATRIIENHLSTSPAARGGASVQGMKKPSSKRGGHVQTRKGTTSILCYPAHAMIIIANWLIGKSLLEDINKVCPLVNLREIYFGLLYSVPEACSQLDCHMIHVSYDYEGTNLWLLNVFYNRETGAYLVQVNVNPSVGDQAHNALAVYAMKKRTSYTLPNLIVAIVTDNSKIMGHVQKMDVDEAVEQESGVGMFQKFLVPNEFKIA